MDLVGVELHPNCKFDLNSPEMCMPRLFVLAEILKMYEQLGSVLYLQLDCSSSGSELWF